jgi:flagellar basal body-associated protein FliL
MKKDKWILILIVTTVTIVATIMVSCSPSKSIYGTLKIHPDKVVVKDSQDVDIHIHYNSDTTYVRNLKGDTLYYRIK